MMKEDREIMQEEVNNAMNKIIAALEEMDVVLRK